MRVTSARLLLSVAETIAQQEIRVGGSMHMQKSLILTPEECTNSFVTFPAVRTANLYLPVTKVSYGFANLLFCGAGLSFFKRDCTGTQFLWVGSEVGSFKLIEL